MGMKIAILGYRDWAQILSRQVASALPDDSVVFRSDFPRGNDAVFAVGWSSIIASADYNQTPTFVLHPSPLPRYRGGSPIQHQILAGETVSAVTLFKLTDEYPNIDSGPIAWQMPYSLNGKLSDVLDRIATVGARGIVDVVNGLRDRTLALIPQPLTDEPTLPRRTPEQSELTMAELTGRSGEYLYNKIRCLQDPYPLPFIRTADGGRLYIGDAEYEPPTGETSTELASWWVKWQGS